MYVEDPFEVTERTAAPHMVRTLPILLLNVHEHCNCRCTMCDIWQRKNTSELSLDRVRDLQASLRELQTSQVVLTGGEPLLHTNFAELCASLKECGVRITLLTTGLLLRKRAADVAALVDEVIVSLDGPEEIHDGIRRVKRGFTLIREGVAALRELRPEIPIHARSTVQKANHAHLRATVDASREIGFDSISFLAADVSSQAFNRELIWPGERQGQISLTRVETETLECEVERLIRERPAEIASRYVVESPEKLRGIARRFREYLGEATPEAPRCNAPWVSAVVEVDGTVRPCFFHRKVGSVSETSLSTVLNSEEALRFRQTLDIANDPICQKCVCSLHYRAHEWAG